MLARIAFVLVLVNALAAQAELECTRAGGPGQIRARVTDALGTTYVAAEHGLFVTRPEVTTLDAMDLRDGVPRGAPVGLVVDGERRLWVATGQEFGWIDPAGGFGRTFTRADGVPEPPYLGLERAGDGAFVVRARAGVWRYLPGPARPTLGVNAPDPAREHEIEFGAPLQVEFAADAEGGATFRYRLGSRHVLQPLASARAAITGLRPGRQEIELYALDRDGDRSDPIVLRVRVLPPPLYSKRTLVLFALATAALVCVPFFVRAARGRRSYWHAALLAIAALVTLAQLVVGFSGHGRAWPLMAFSMYSETYREDDLLHHARLYGLREDGALQPLWPEHFAMTADGMWQLLLPLLCGSEAERERILARFVDPARAGSRVRAIEVRNDRYRLTREGPRRVAATILAHWPRKAGDGRR